MSVVIPAYKEGEFIAKTLESLSGQTLVKKFPQEVEILVVDYDPDGDFETKQAVAKYNARYLTVDRKGIGYTRHFGAVTATGRVLMSFDADSVFAENTAMERLVMPVVSGEVLMAYPRSVPAKHPDTLIDVINHGVQTVADLTTDVYGSLGTWFNDDVGWNSVGMAINRDTYFELGGFNDVYRSEDGNFLRRFDARYGTSRRKRIETTVVMSTRRLDAVFSGDLNAWFSHENTAYR